MKSPVYILGIESSCDETSAAVLCGEEEISNVIANQNLIHRYFGGVVPELASRAHQQKIIPVVDEALKQANITKNQINAIAVTSGPGLMGALLVGVSFAKAMSLGLKIPLIDVNHMQGHVLAHFIRNKSNISDEVPAFPFLCLTVSGGHTQIVLVKDYLDMQIIGETLDDAAGEAFDKAAKILGLPYPGGPLIDKHAADGKHDRFPFPKPSIAGFDYSFSGLKTSFLNFIRNSENADQEFISKNLNDICASIQHTIIEILLNKIRLAVKETGIKDVAIAGGVSANSGLRKRITDLKKELGCRTFIPPFQYCTDNAAMIAITGYFKHMRGEYSTLDLVPKARMPF
ncbi:MAG: tRNA (adenosine(37)-N6)-threonylcarbamoyltransferase complex transferase subunit TsaD [Bacteroidetes bacterium]|nr:MAG: tRNA (adenosine(37)-N6)-threonylcarbamoyltransferase complex transferase subunit TsaD [Bacteroidota bacterium]REK00068.1 MAG: tRNA (adenosine(37)-N6)-threonylcarbamoyltransferase complex transferase subunit TsaD [Bacteroidota bacterium]REK34288.1 MAG: tRNA (adenosine(37)-N6)-threonylcarbamoyltransferase complex transferase subunit TsaD [Bacteroidota bacterium]REK50698.1 MAG: tRNA (adenosine(37)-N6)-threonylcarbamoyltransferase complex transferase subunit TsaD [Bacteroidota bacterium]